MEYFLIVIAIRTICLYLAAVSIFPSVGSITRRIGLLRWKTGLGTGFVGFFIGHDATINTGCTYKLISYGDRAGI